MYVVTSAGCSRSGDNEAQANHRKAAAPNDTSTILKWESSITLEEGPQVITVSPRSSIDPSGGFLVADYGVSQIRKYDEQGNLLWFNGREGDGPGELKKPTSVVRLNDQRVLVGDSRSRIVIFSPEGDSAVETFAIPVERLSGIVVLDDTSVLIEGLGRTGALLHVMNVRTHQLTSDFFSPGTNYPYPRTYNLTSAAGVSLRGDTIAALHMAIDSVFFFSRSGDRLGAVRIPSDNLVSAGDQPENPKTSADYLRWLQTNDLLHGLHWLEDGTLVLQYSRQSPAGIAAFHLVHMTPDGRRLADIPSLSLIAVNGATGKLYFVDPEADAFNTWQVATLVSR
jgi:hypothetical protein